MRENAKKWLLIIWLVLVLLGCLLSVYLSRSYEQSMQIEIANLQICDYNKSQNDASTQGACGEVLPESTKELYLCGLIESPKRVMNPIYYLYKEGSKYPVKNGDLTNETGGEFCTQMKLPNNNLSGNYTVKVLYFRNVISLVAFRIP